MNKAKAISLLSVIIVSLLLSACDKSNSENIDTLEAFVGKWNASPTCGGQRIAFDLTINRIDDSSGKLEFQILINRNQSIPMFAVVDNDKNFVLDSLSMFGTLYFGRGTMISDKISLDFSTTSTDSVTIECPMSLCKLE